MTALNPIPLATLDRPICFVGATGSGKTTAAKGAVEQLLDAGRRVVVVDPTGVWWGLRLCADGAPGYPVVIFGGEHADVPIGAGAGERLGRLLAGGSVGAAIVDTSDLSTGETVALLTPFFEALYAGLRGALHLVVDEADAVAPQNPMPEGRRLLGVVDKIARRGRVKGFRPLWITQRPAVLNKNVLSQVSTLVAMQLRSPQDRKALDSWIQGNADAEAARGVVRQLPGLPVGDGFVWAPGEDRLDRVAFPPCGTFDSSRAPEPGEADAAVAPLGAVDVAALRAALAEPLGDPAPEKPCRAPRRAAAPNEADPAAGAPAAWSTSPAATSALAEAYAAGYRHALELVERTLMASVGDLVADLRRDVPTSRADAEARPVTVAALAAPGRAPPPTPFPPVVPARSAAKSRRRVIPAGASAELNSAARKMLAVLDTDPPVRRSWPTVARLAVLKASGGHYSAGRRQLLDAALVVEEGGLVRIAAPSAGAEAYGSDPDGLLAAWSANLGGLAARILGVLGEGGWQTRSGLAEALLVSPRGGHWSGAWKALRDNGLVDEGDAGVRLSSLFREG